MPSALAIAADRLQLVRAAVPLPLVPRLVERRLDRIWDAPGYRAAAEESMEFLLGCSERAAEVPTLARRYAACMISRSYLRWHPRAICAQPVRDVEWLTQRRDPRRGVLLSFAHHAQYDGLFASIARHGVHITAVMTSDMMGDDAPSAFRQHHRVVRRGAEVIPATLGTDHFADLLRGGATLALASDVPGRTPVRFLGRPVLGSFGAARLAAMTDSPVVLVTTRRDDAGPYLQVHPPLEPRDFDGPAGLLEAILSTHGDAVLAWPEAFESPKARFGRVDPSAS